MFSFMEETITKLKQMDIFSHGRNTLLRMCNDLLRRLSKSQNTVFCGHIQYFLSRLFPIDEKSGLNLMGNFNLEKDVSYNNEVDQDDGDSNSSVHFKIYSKFWSLQEFFQNPTLCYDKARWDIFSDNVSIVLSTFHTIKLDNTDSSSHFCDSKIELNKYLTSERLLELQLMDLDFRRNILVQMLIIFQYLVSPVKFKTPEQVLKDDQKAWVDSKTVTVYKLLSSGSSSTKNDASFVDIVKSILEGELTWSQWKNEGCPSFIPKEGISKRSSELPMRKRRVNPLVDRSGKLIYRFDSPSLNLLKWSSSEESLEACKDPSRMFQPNLAEYFENAILELDPEQKVDEEYQSINKEEWCWRSLRLLARQSRYIYQQWDKPGLPLKHYLTNILTQNIKPVDKANGDSGSTEKSHRNGKGGSGFKKLPDDEKSKPDADYAQTLDSNVSKGARPDDSPVDPDEDAGSDEGEVADELDDSQPVQSRAHHKRSHEDREEGEELDDDEDL
ncbi:THO complex subunit 1 [Cichlidogyrus casuarinus]|uniref:THO complex subunit 1 n=1 Tax=Cichlidogyrus casuarinus TaxID=1844966 RepID=A0ABD2Q9P2_9PLAT